MRTRPSIKGRSPTLRAMPAPPSGCFEAVLDPSSVALAPIFEASLEIHGYVAHRHGHAAITPEASGGNVVRRTYAVAAARFRELREEQALLFLDARPADLADETLFATISDLASRVVIQLRGTGLPPEPAAFFADVRRLRAKGFRFALADLDGSPLRLALIVDLAPEYVKLDVGDVESSVSRRVFLGALVQTCQRHGATPIAAGVASFAQGAVLGKLGCSMFEMQPRTAARPITAALRGSG